jgi:hypothetical protein
MFIRKKDYKYLIIIILLTMLFIFVGLNDISNVIDTIENKIENLFCNEVENVYVDTGAKLNEHIP